MPRVAWAQFSVRNKQRKWKKNIISILTFKRDKYKVQKWPEVRIPCKANIFSSRTANIRSKKTSEVMKYQNVKSFQDLISSPDVALIKLERPVQFSSFVRPICLNQAAAEKPFCPDNSQDRRRLQPPFINPNCLLFSCNTGGKS